MPCGNIFQKLTRKYRNKSKRINEASPEKPKCNPDISVTKCKTTDLQNPVLDTTQRLPSPTKSPNDKNKYSVLRIPNGITLTIISEPSISTVTERFSACAVTIQAGSFQDPEDIPGLAHLLEHVVSMGSRKYPGENELDGFISQKGGSSNAQVESEYTTFYFECHETDFPTSLDVVSQFFLSPSLNPKEIRKETKMASSEFEEVVHNDNARRMQLICSLADSTNPAKKFSWGNRSTLVNNVKEKHLIKALHTFRKMYYTADRMKIAIQSTLPTKHIEDTVIRCFSRMPTSCKILDRPLERLTEPFDSLKFCMMYRVQSIADICELSLNWILPPMQTKYRSKPIEYLSYVIGYEGEGSLIFYLRKLQLVLFLTADVEESGICSNSIYTIFTISVTLTEQGQVKIFEIITIIFGFLKMLTDKGVSESIYCELKQIADTRFRFAHEASSLNNVKKISQDMAVFPSEDYLTGWALFFEYNPNDIIEYLSKMTPSRANVLLHMKNHVEELDKEESWFKTKYRVDSIPDNWLDTWKNATPHYSFKLPNPNPFITADFRLVAHNNTTEYPIQLIKNQSYEIWYKGNIAKSPYAFLNIFINIPQMSQCIDNVLCQVLFNKIFTYQMIDDLYMAHVAQFRHSMTTTESGVNISIHGFRRNLAKFVNIFSRGFSGMSKAIKEHKQLLRALKKAQKRHILNVILDGRQLVDDIRVGAVCFGTYLSSDKYSRVSNITEDKFIEYVNNVFKDVYVHAIADGNIEASEVEKIIAEFIDTLHIELFDKSKLATQMVAKLPQGESIIHLSAFNTEDANCHTQIYCQYGPGQIEEIASLEFIALTMDDSLYAEFRTIEQIGYSVSISTSNIHGILGLIISVESQIRTFTPEYVRTRIDGVMQKYLLQFHCLTDKSFNASKNAVIAMKRVIFSQRNDKYKNGWCEIKNQIYNFSSGEKIMAALQNMNKKFVESVVNKLFNCQSTDHKKLVIQLIGHMYNTNKEINLIRENEIEYDYVNICGDKSLNYITNLKEWKNSLLRYESTKETRNEGSTF